MAAISDAKMTIKTAARPTYKMSIYTATVVNTKNIYTRLSGPYIKFAIHTSVIFNAKIAIYTAARPTYENCYIHGNRFQCINGYIHGSRPYIYKMLYTQQFLEVKNGYNTAAVWLTASVHTHKVSVSIMRVNNYLTYPAALSPMQKGIYTAVVIKCTDWIYRRHPFMQRMKNGCMHDSRVMYSKWLFAQQPLSHAWIGYIHGSRKTAMAVVIYTAADLHIKIAAYMATVLKKMFIYTAAVWDAKMSIYTSAGPIYKYGYTHGSHFRCKTVNTAAGPIYKYGYIHDSRFRCKTVNKAAGPIYMAIYTAAIFDAKLKTRLPGLHIKIGYIYCSRFNTKNLIYTAAGPTYKTCYAQRPGTLKSYETCEVFGSKKWIQHGSRVTDAWDHTHTVFVSIMRVNNYLTYPAALSPMQKGIYTAVVIKCTDWIYRRHPFMQRMKNGCMHDSRVMHSKWSFAQQPLSHARIGYIHGSRKTAMAVVIYTAADLHIKIAAYMATVLNAKMAIYTAVGPTYKMAIFTAPLAMLKWLYTRLPCLHIKWLYKRQPFSMQKLLYTRLPGLHIKWLYIRQPFGMQKCPYTRLRSLYINIAIHTAAIFDAKL